WHDLPSNPPSIPRHQHSADAKTIKLNDRFQNALAAAISETAFGGLEPKYTDAAASINGCFARSFILAWRLL
ncbi:MAG: hypothetical protein ABJC87_14355, partial [Roseobacter sp.]